MNKNELIERTNIDSIINLLNFIECERNFQNLSLNNIDLNGKKYSIYKVEDNISIYTKGSPLLVISNKEVDPNDCYDYGKRDIKITYKLDNNDLLSLEGNATLGESIISKEDLVTNLKPYYYKGTKLERYELKDNLMPKELDSNDEGLTYHNLVLTEDGKEILKINGEKIPRRSEIENFDYLTELSKITILYEATELNGVTEMLFNKEFCPITREKLEEFTKKLEKKSKYLKNFSKDYERVTDRVTELIEVRNGALEGAKSINYKEEELSNIFKKLFSISDEKRFDKESLKRKALVKE